MAFNDETFSCQIKIAKQDGFCHFLVVVNDLIVLVFKSKSAKGPWLEIGVGDFDSLSLKEILKPECKDKVLFGKTSKDIESLDVKDISTSVFNKSDFKTWQTQRDVLTGFKKGRLGDANEKTKKIVAELAAWRCQFPGCGEDLRTHLPTGAKGNFSYFAHIVAASKEGPRGDEILSPKLANDPENFLLLCDKCHRLIDRIELNNYSAARLNKIREQSVVEVSRLLDSLKFQEVEVISIVGNIAGQAPHWSFKQAEEALWGAKLRAKGGRSESYFNIGGYLYDTHKPHYWGSLLQVLKSDLGRLQSLLTGTSQEGRPRPALAVFGLHATSVLVLAGRVLGDTSGIHVFQPNRNQSNPWMWSDSIPKPLPNKFQLNTLKPSVIGATEACLLVSLTYRITADRLPSNILDGSDFKIPTLELTASDLAHDIISHPEDLVLLGCKIDEALRLLQDEWHIQRVHLFIGAPASASIKMGQKMQARHHATFICHETGIGGQSAFIPTIEINADTVLEPKTRESLSLPL